MIKTYAEVCHELVHATSHKALRDASQLIQYVENLDHREELARIYKSRALEFKSPIR
jgi:hypothetical protein